MREGWFVTVEGIDGSGKTTLTTAIEDEYGDAVVPTSEPSDLWTGKQVRRAIANDTDEVHPFVTFFLFMADRKHHINTRIEPALADGHLVVSDRYADSTLAYQPVALADHLHHPQPYMEMVMSPWSITPDLTLFVDITVDTAIERMDGTEEYEQRAFLEQVRDNYLDLVDRLGDRVVILDGERPRDDVVADAIQVVEERRE